MGRVTTLFLLLVLLSGCGVQSTPTPVAPAGAGTGSSEPTPRAQSTSPVALLSRKAIPPEGSAPAADMLPVISDAAQQTAAGVPEGWTTLLDDAEFEDSNPNMWGTGEAEGGVAELARGELRIHAEKGWQISSYPLVAQDLKDAYISATFKTEGKGRAGVMARFAATD